MQPPVLLLLCPVLFQPHVSRDDFISNGLICRVLGYENDPHRTAFLLQHFATMEPWSPLMKQHGIEKWDWGFAAMDC